MMRYVRGALRRLKGTPRVDPTPLQRSSTYAEPGNQWYHPATGGPSSFIPDVVGSQPVRDAQQILNELSSDEYLEYVKNFYRAGLETFGDNWVYADINTVLIGLTRRLRPENYLEIGVRRGRSMAMVATHAPECTIVGFDLWISDYAGMENPGPQYVRDQLSKIGYRGELELVTGDSRQTIPKWFADHPGQFFDIITVDGDHSTEGARIDLENVLSRLKIGGALVFDDISNHSHPTLSQVWKDYLARHENLGGYSFSEVGFGVGFAIRSR